MSDNLSLHGVTSIEVVENNHLASCVTTTIKVIKSDWRGRESRMEITCFNLEHDIPLTLDKKD